MVILHNPNSVSLNPWEDFGGEDTLHSLSAREMAKQLGIEIDPKAAQDRLDFETGKRMSLESDEGSTARKFLGKYRNVVGPMEESIPIDKLLACYRSAKAWLASDLDPQHHAYVKAILLAIIDGELPPK